MKIGIITEYKKVTVNYGNNLQTYALNAYLRKQYPHDEIKTFYFADIKRKIVSARAFLRKVAERLRRIFVKEKLAVPEMDRKLVKTRLAAFTAFQKEYIAPYSCDMTWSDLQQSNVDIFIVGSDVVWAQGRYILDRIKFLDFHPRKKAVKMSYAASFGENWIPKDNQRVVRKCLKKFDAISVRERSAITLLESVGVCGAVQTLDPTLLLTAQEWSTLERKPADIRLPEQYVFVYLLGTDKKQMEQISIACKRNGLMIVTIPYAGGINDSLWADFGEVWLPSCSPQEWLWCVHHASYVITDSFHGIVFSTIFENRFFAVPRNYSRDINIRILDYLDTICQQDKMVNMQGIGSFAEFTWDYTQMRQILTEKIQTSRAFLKQVIKNADSTGNKSKREEMKNRCFIKQNEMCKDSAQEDKLNRYRK